MKIGRDEIGRPRTHYYSPLNSLRALTKMGFDKRDY